MKENFTLGILLRDINASLREGNFYSFFLKLQKEAKKEKIKVVPITPKSKFESFDIVYDRFFSKTKKDMAERKRFILRCREEKKPVFNENNFIILANNKWKTYLFLKRNKKFKKYLPETHLFKSDSLLEKFLEKEKSAILKPNIGEKGKGIFLLKKQEEGYLVNFQDLNFKNQEVKIKKISEIKRVFKNWPSQKYIFQKEIDRAKYKNKFFDIRVLLQKTNNKWEVIVISARVARENCFLTNISRGGEGKKGKNFYTLLKTVFPENFHEIINRIKKLSTEIAGYFDKKIDGYIFEVGVDLVLDKKGKIWIIEINSKPGRSFYSKGFIKKIPQRRVLPLIDFAKRVYLRR